MSLSGVVKAMVEVIAATEDRENPGMRLAHRLSGRSRRSSVPHGQARLSIYTPSPPEDRGVADGEHLSTNLPGTLPVASPRREVWSMEI